MSISPVSPYSINPSGSVYLASTQATNVITSKPTPSAAVSDTVNLSGVALALSLRHQGFSVEGIAAKLGTSVRTVDQYLGIVVSKK